MTRKIIGKKRYEEILRVASDLFRKRGYNHVTMDDIGKEIGISKLSIYYYFESKEDLYITILDKGIRSLVKNLKEILNSDKSYKEKLRLVIINHIKYISSAISPEATALKRLLYISDSNRKKMIKKRDNYDKEVIGLIKKGIEQKEFIGYDAKLAYFVIVGAANSIANWYSKTGPLSIEEIADFFSRFLIRSLLIDGNINPS